jgi:SAM-dependent methyltransferase
MSHFEDFYWWHVGRRYIVREQLRNLGIAHQSILNIGCGTGGLVEVLEQFGEVFNADISKEALEFCREKGIKNLSQVTDGKLKFPDHCFDVIVATDVLEHIDEEESALKEWRRVLKPSGTLLLTVPAYQWLWSAHDDALCHKRRYTAAGLHMRMHRAQFKVSKRSYCIVFSFPLIVAYRLYASIAKRSEAESSYVVLPSIINSLFVFLLYLEARLTRYINFPFGTSILMCVNRS